MRYSLAINPYPADFISVFQANLLGGVNVLTGPGRVQEGDEQQEVLVQLIPYYAWSHRGHGAMSVWFEQE